MKPKFTIIFILIVALGVGLIGLLFNDPSNNKPPINNLALLNRPALIINNQTSLLSTYQTINLLQNQRGPRW